MSPEIKEWSHKSRSRINNLYLLIRPIALHATCLRLIVSHLVHFCTLHVLTSLPLTTDLYEVPDAIPPIHAVCSHG